MSPAVKKRMHLAVRLLRRVMAVAQEDKPLKVTREAILDLYEANFHGYDVGLVPPPGTGRFPDRNPMVWTSDDVAEWRELVRFVIEDCVGFDRAGNVIEWADEAVTHRGEQPLGRLQVSVSSNPRFAAVRVSGPYDRIAMFQLVTLIRFVGIDRIRACDCKRVFLKIGRREFCSERCQNRVYMRSYIPRVRDGKAKR